MLRRQIAIGNDLIKFGRIGNVNHRVSAKLGVVRNDDYALSTLHHRSNRLDYQRTGIAQTLSGEAANSQDCNVGGNAVEHALAYGAKLDAEAAKTKKRTA